MAYRLTDDDIAIFEASQQNGSIFTAYYFDNCISILDDGTRIEGWQFLPWQLRAHHGPEPEQTIIGGFGCLAADAGVYDVELGREIPIEELCVRKYAPLVLAWTGLGFTAIRAHVPFRKGKTTLYRVVTEGGREIRATAEHRFLTPEGWQQLGNLSCGSLLGVPANLPEPIRAGGVCHCRERPQGYLDDCSPYPHQCDARPHPVLGIAQVLAPLQGDAHECSRDYPRLDVPGEQGQGCIHPDHSAYHHARRDFAHPVEPRALSIAECDVVSFACGLARRQREDQGHWQYAHSPNQVLPIPESVEETDQAVRASSFYAHDQASSLRQVVCGISIDRRGKCPSDSGPPPMCQVHPAAFLGVPWLEKTSLFHVCSPSDKSSDHSMLNSITWDRICQIEEVGEDYFYDVHVPIFNNYVANGLVHHNTGKTGGYGISGFVWCATTPMFKFLEAAPVGWQSLQMFQYITERLENSRAKRFLARKPVTRPYPKITFYNGSTMEFMSADEQGERIKTWEGDWVIVDQGEDVDELDETIRNLGSRLRGRRPDGSTRLGRLTVLANAGDSPELWDRYDQAETYPGEYLSMTISYMDNVYLTEIDRRNLERRAGGTPELIDQWLRGKRPIGRGEHFPWSMVEPCLDPALDEIMARAIREKRPGFVYQEAPKCGCVWWEMPPEKGRSYLVIGDPGQNDPPHRNSPVIMVWDITDFPVRPAVLRCFRWIFGGGFYNPFLAEFIRLVDLYKAHGQCAFDSTGVQKAFDELTFTLEGLLAEGMNVQGEKFLMLNHAKLLMGKIMFKFPRLKGMTHQLTHYKLPDTKIRQDIVSVVIMTAGWLRRLLWRVADEEDDELALEENRMARSGDRIARSR